LKNRNGGKEDTECRRRKRRSGKGVGGKEQAEKNKLEKQAGKNERERIGGKEVSWRN
jgi:hypothetical protein